MEHIYKIDFFFNEQYQWSFSKFKILQDCPHLFKKTYLNSLEDKESLIDIIGVTNPNAMTGVSHSFIKSIDKYYNLYIFIS